MCRPLKNPRPTDDGLAQEVLMTINSIASPSAVNDVQPVTPPATSSSSSLAADAANGVSVDISRPGKLFGDLASLAQSDPDQFKAVTADIAKKLKDAAGSEGGSRADFLNKLAVRFDSAAQSGSAADLAPAGKARGGHRHGGHHRMHGAGRADPTGASGDGSGDSLAQVLQGIISGALGSTSAAAATTTAATAPAPVSAPTT
jgi:hypothetical protein